jgi:dihydropteroate synthase
MGVVNVTPDSFSDGGRFFDRQQAIEQGRALVAQGADLVDVGGESSRPGATPVALDEELRRIIPVIEALAPITALSVDTVKPEVARAAVAAGASLVNDVSGSLAPVAAELGVGWVAMHRQGTPATMQDHPTYGDVVAEVHGALFDLARRAQAAGVSEVWLDPGIGFGKTAEHNLRLLAHVGELVAQARELGCRVLVGASRKRFLGAFGAAPAELGPDDRLEASLATATWCLAQGVDMVRVHDVAATVQCASLVRGLPAGVAA